MVKISTVSHRTHTKPVRAGNGRLKTTEPTTRSRVEYVAGASQACNRYVGQSRREKLPLGKTKGWGQVTVPVLSSTNKALMPTRPARARDLIKSGKAVKRWFRGIFCIKLLDRAEGNVQQIAAGVDPGSKREGFTVKSEFHTYLNVLSDAITWVKGRVEERCNARRARRFRKTPCRKNKSNRNINNRRLPPSTRSRWQIKLNILKFLVKLYPISDICVEDIKAKTKKGKSIWNVCFSPLEVGKEWFYKEVSKLGNLTTKLGFETAELRKELGLKKSSKKMDETFDAHNVDSWVLANSIVNGHTKPDCKDIYRIVPLQLHRRQLHRFQPGLKGIRKPYGGTNSLGFKRGSVVIHNKLGRVYVGGNQNGKVSLHDLKTGVRITKYGSNKDFKFLHLNRWRTQFFCHH